MSSIQVTTKGDFNKTQNYLRRLQQLDLTDIFHKYGAMGVTALAAATPVESGLSSQSWYYIVEKKPPYQRIRWMNSDVVEGVPIVILVEYGHATRNGGLVQARPFIMQAIGPVIQQCVDEVWREVTKD